MMLVIAAAIITCFVVAFHQMVEGMKKGYDLAINTLTPTEYNHVGIMVDAKVIATVINPGIPAAIPQEFIEQLVEEEPLDSLTQQIIDAAIESGVELHHELLFDDPVQEYLLKQYPMINDDFSINMARDISKVLNGDYSE